MSNTFHVILPNLKYQEDDVYFICRGRPLKLKKNGKFYYKKELPLFLKKRSYSFKYEDVQYECTIKEKEEEDGLIVFVKYESTDGTLVNHDSSKTRQLAKLFESYVLNIPYSPSKNEKDTDEKTELFVYCQKEIKKNSESSSLYNNEDDIDDLDEKNREKNSMNHGESEEEFNGHLFENRRRR
jgi:hypothetical protein